MIMGNVMFKEEEIAQRRAMLGVFILEDLEVKKDLVENNIKIRRIRGEREVRLTLPEGWSLVRTGRLDKRLHFICNPQMEPIFATFSAHLTEIPTRGWVKRTKDCRWLSGNNSIVLGYKVDIQPLEINDFISAPGWYPYQGLFFWEKVPGVVFLCTEERKPIGELCARYHETFVRRRKNDEAYTVGQVEEVEDDDNNDYGPNGTHRHTVSAGEFVRIDKLTSLQAEAAGPQGSLKQICTSSIIEDERLLQIYAEPGKLPLGLKKEIDILILCEELGRKE